MTRTISRRAVLALPAALAAVPAAAQPAAPGAHQQILARIAAGRTPVPGLVRVRLPEIADNGNTVPITVAVDSPMTATSHVTAIHVVTDGNPRPEVFTARLGPAAGRAEISTRIRLARSMTVTAYAETSDGRLLAGSAEGRVTLGGCGS